MTSRNVRVPATPSPAAAALTTSKPVRCHAGANPYPTVKNEKIVVPVMNAAIVINVMNDRNEGLRAVPVPVIPAAALENALSDPIVQQQVDGQQAEAIARQVDGLPVEVNDPIVLQQVGVRPAEPRVLIARPVTGLREVHKVTVPNVPEMTVLPEATALRAYRHNPATAAQLVAATKGLPENQAASAADDVSLLIQRS